MSDWSIVSRDTGDQLGEGVLWSARNNAVYWVDILAPALNRLSLADGRVARWKMPEQIGWIVERDRGGFIAGFQSGFAELQLEPLTIRMIGNPEPHLPGNRMNDGKADTDGYIWCGTKDMTDSADTGSLYRLAPDRSWSTMDTGYGVPNGPAFSPDGAWLFHTDSARRTVYRFARSSNGGLSARTAFITFNEEDGFPDGMTFDSEGGLWIAHWGGSRISRFLPDGQLDRLIRLPARLVSNIAFAGEDLDRMFVTSATVGLDPGPMEGALFEVHSGATGVPTGLFAG